MTAIDTTIQKEILLNQKTAVMEELSQLAIYHEATDDWEARIDEGTNQEADDDLVGDAAEAAEEQIATLALLETDYRNVVRALMKIESGTYGICEVGGEAIEPARLQALPAARTCIAHMDAEIDLPL